MSTQSQNGAPAERFEINARDLKKTAEAIRGHDRALQNVAEEIQAFETHLEAIIQAQSRIAEGLREVARFQSRVTSAQGELEGTLASVLALADEKVPAAVSTLKRASGAASTSIAESVAVLQRVLGDADAVTSSLPVETATEAARRLEASTKAHATQLQATVEQSVREAHESIEKGMNRWTASVERALAKHGSLADGAAARVSAAADKVEASHTAMSDRIDALDRTLALFVERTDTIREDLEGKIAAREEELRVSQSALESVVQRARKLFG